MNIKKSIYLWMGGLAVCFFFLAFSLIFSTNRMQSMSNRLLVDSRAIETALQLENAILGERREDLLWRETGGEEYLDLKRKLLKESKELIGGLTATSTSLEEEELILIVEDSYARYLLEAERDPPASLITISRLADDLLASIHAYWKLNQEQMATTQVMSERLNRWVDIWSVALIILVSVLTFSGAIQLVRRIIMPISALNRTALAFGRGETDIKARVYHTDELGVLSRTFNEMIENITELQQERSRFIACIAHDLKNPLMLIGGTARRLRKKGKLADDQALQVERIIDQADAVEEIILDLLDIMRLQDGSFTFKMKEIRFDELIRTLVGKEAEMITTHRFDYRCDCACVVMGDERRLQRVFENLISNSVKYSDKNSFISVILEKSDDKAVLSVINQGVGIPADKIPLLFQPFTRLSHTKQMAKGTGLGLYSAKKIIDGHRGEITVKSSPGRDTRVQIILPLVDA